MCWGAVGTLAVVCGRPVLPLWLRGSRLWPCDPSLHQNVREGKSPRRPGLLWEPWPAEPIVAQVEVPPGAGQEGAGAPAEGPPRHRPLTPSCAHGRLRGGGPSRAAWRRRSQPQAERPIQLSGAERCSFLPPGEPGQAEAIHSPPARGPEPPAPGDDGREVGPPGPRSACPTAVNARVSVLGGHRAPAGPARRAQRPPRACVQGWGGAGRWPIAPDPVLPPGTRRPFPTPPPSLTRWVCRGRSPGGWEPGQDSGCLGIGQGHRRA